MINHIIGYDELDDNQQFQADLNQDGSVTVQDLILMLDIILETSSFPVASFTIFYGTFNNQQEFFDGDTIPTTYYLSVNGSSSYSPIGYDIVEWRWSRVRNGIAMTDVIQEYSEVSFAGGSGWVGECSVTLTVTDSGLNESEPVTISWTGE